MIKTRIYLFLFSSLLLAQSNSEMVKINISTTMDIAFAGKIFLNTTQLASSDFYNEEVVSKYEKFYVRMFAGGNKTVGKILDKQNQALIMYDKDEKKYSQEMFKSIKENNGVPSLKDVTKMEPGGSRDRSGSSDSTRSNNQNNVNREITRIISNDLIDINGFNCRKISTKISDNNGSVQIDEWITSDTSLFEFVENKLIGLIALYGGIHEKPRGSFDWIKAIDPNKKIDSIKGEIIKSSIVWKNDEGKNSFSMTREVLSAVTTDYTSEQFEILKKFKKVPNLD